MDMEKVMVPTYNADVKGSVNWLMEHVKNARWDVVARAMNVMNAGVYDIKENLGNAQCIEVTIEVEK